MFEKIRQKITTTSKETIKEECKRHAPEIAIGAAVLMLAYLCIKVNCKPINVTINLNSAQPKFF